MAEGAICQTLYSRPRWWSEPFARSLLTIRDGGRSFLPSALLQAVPVERTLHTKPLDGSRWRKELFAKRFTPGRVGGTSLAARRFIPKLVGARMLLPRPFHLPTSIGRTFFPNLPAMPRVPGLEAVCAHATVRNGLSSYSPRAFHHIIAANSANRGGHFRKTLRPFQRNATAFSPKRSGLFSKTPQPFHQNAPAFSAKHLGLFTKKRHRTEQGFSLCPARCLDVQTIVRCLLLADLAHRQVGCGSSHKD